MCRLKSTALESSSPRPGPCAAPLNPPAALQASWLGVRRTGPKHTARFWWVILLKELKEATKLRWSSRRDSVA